MQSSLSKISSVIRASVDARRPSVVRIVVFSLQSPGTRSIAEVPPVSGWRT